jgi:hypothetical protein
VDDRQRRTWISIVVGVGALGILGLIIWVIVQVLKAPLQ